MYSKIPISACRRVCHDRHQISLHAITDSPFLIGLIRCEITIKQIWCHIEFMVAIRRDLSESGFQ